jgi:hypothetical protein
LSEREGDLVAFAIAQECERDPIRLAPGAHREDMGDRGRVADAACGVH